MRGVYIDGGRGTVRGVTCSLRAWAFGWSVGLTYNAGLSNGGAGEPSDGE